MRFLFLLYLFVILEIASRGYFAYRAGCSFWWPSDLHYRFYPELRDTGVDRIDIRRDDDTFDVLLLSGSVLNPRFGNVEALLREQLAAAMHRPVRVFNLSMLAHTSRDSLHKYSFLGNRRFDLVILCHGMNEVRMNNAPPGAFKAGYTHCSWYARFAAMRDHRELPAVTLPYLLHYTWIGVAEKTGLGEYLPQHNARRESLDYGSDVRTGATLRANVRAILDLAKERGDPVLLTTYACYIPADYSIESLRAGKLEWNASAMPIESWGRPDNVRKAVDRHNEVLRELAAGGGVMLVDAARLIEPSAANFSDVCHLTRAGCEKWVEAVMAVIARRVVAE